MAETIRRSSSGFSTGWEYRVQTIGSFFGTNDETIATTLNEWGEDGWEAINVFTPEGSGKITVVAKRPLTDRVRRQRSMPSYEEK